MDQYTVTKIKEKIFLLHYPLDLDKILPGYHISETASQPKIVLHPSLLSEVSKHVPKENKKPLL